MAIQFPKGMFMSMVKVGEKGQIVIPKGAREMFKIKAGDNLLLMADEQRGIAIVSANDFMDGTSIFMDTVRKVREEGEK